MRERYGQFRSAGVYVHLRKRPDRSPEYLYVGRASGSPDLLVRQVRHYVGSLGLLYYIEPKLTNKKTSPEDFARAIELLSDRAKFKTQVDKVFDEMDSQLVYLARCAKAEAVVAESVLIGEWQPERNREGGARVTNPPPIIHLPAVPGTE